MKIIFLSLLSAQSINTEKKIHTFVYEIYDKRFCFLTPDPFLCIKCLEQDMQIGKLIIFKEDEILRINTCVPYKKKYLY